MWWMVVPGLALVGSAGVEAAYTYSSRHVPHPSLSILVLFCSFHLSLVSFCLTVLHHHFVFLFFFC